MKNRSHIDLLDWVQESTEIFCSMCDESETEGLSIYDGSLESLFEEGWRATNKNVYCPKCAGKYLKKK